MTLAGKLVANAHFFDCGRYNGVNQHRLLYSKLSGLTDIEDEIMTENQKHTQEEPTEESAATKKKLDINALAMNPMQVGMARMKAQKKDGKNDEPAKKKRHWWSRQK